MHARPSVSWIDRGSFSSLLERAGVSKEDEVAGPVEGAAAAPVSLQALSATSTTAHAEVNAEVVVSRLPLWSEVRGGKVVEPIAPLAKTILASTGVAEHDRGSGIADRSSEMTEVGSAAPAEAREERATTTEAAVGELQLPPATAVVDDVWDQPEPAGPLQVEAEPPPATDPFEFVPPDSTQERRFEVLLNWLSNRFGVASCFVADADGLPLRARDCDGDIIAIGSTLLSTWRAISRDSSFGDSGVLCVETGAGTWLFLMLAEGQWGRFCLGVGSRNLLEMQQVEALRRAFRAAVEA